MKVLIFGPSGAGKTYISSKFREMGVSAVDGELIKGLSAWFDEKGNKILNPKGLDNEFLSNLTYLWDIKFLEDYLNKNPKIYLFGSLGNLSEVVSLFDKVFFLKVEPKLLADRLANRVVEDNQLVETEKQQKNAISWSLESEEIAKSKGAILIDASLEPEEIYKIISS